jgi:hypothetical protein
VRQTATTNISVHAVFKRHIRKKLAYLMMKRNSVAEKSFEIQHQMMENIQNNSNVY